jgi:hypothetical protein
MIPGAFIGASMFPATYMTTGADLTPHVGSYPMNEVPLAFTLFGHTITANRKVGAIIGLPLTDWSGSLGHRASAAGSAKHQIPPCTCSSLRANRLSRN